MGELLDLPLNKHHCAWCGGTAFALYDGGRVVCDWCLRLQHRLTVQPKVEQRPALLLPIAGVAT